MTTSSPSRRWEWRRSSPRALRSRRSSTSSTSDFARELPGSAPGTAEPRLPATVLAEDSYRLGELRLKLVPDAPVFMDAGAMFGLTPKTLWIKHKTADDRNRV